MLTILVELVEIVEGLAGGTADAGSDDEGAHEDVAGSWGEEGWFERDPLTLYKYASSITL